MAFKVATIPTSGGDFFKPAQQVEGATFLIEVKSFQAQKPGNYGPKDTVVADITTFNTEADLAAGTPSAISKGGIINSTYLAADLETLVGEATVVKLGQTKPKAGQKPAWVWRQADAAAIEKVVAYGETRDAELAAEAEDAPDF